MLRSLLAVLALALAGVSCRAHICLLSPSQRGGKVPPSGYPLMPGDPLCFTREPCKRDDRAPLTATYKAGEPLTVSVQQNLNHYFAARPGFIDVAIGGRVIATVGDYPAHEMVTQTNFSLDVQHIPEVKECSDRCVMQVRYVSYNPDEVDPKNNTDAIFYACADVRVEANAAAAVEASGVLPARSASVAAPFSCEPNVKQFTLRGRTFGVPGQEIEHFLAFDGIKERVRWVRSGSLPSGHFRRDVLTFYNTTKGPQDYIIFDNEKCVQYGPDAFYAWSFGKGNEKYVGKHPFEGVQTHVWEISDQVFLGASVDECLPVFLEVRPQQGPKQRTFFSVRTHGVVEKNFEIPSLCKK
jgi:hypothetical protein